MSDAQQRSLFDDDAAAAARADGITRAEFNAPATWRSCARWAIRGCAFRGDFTADDVLDALARAGVESADVNLAALGPVFLAAARAGEIVKTGELRPSRIPRRHRDLTVWRAP